MVRNLCVALVLAALAGCNAVTSERPLFGAAAAADAPDLRTGLWVMPTDGCKVAVRAPIASWPDCANGFVLSDTGLKGGTVDKAGGFQREATYQKVGGDPLLLQIIPSRGRASDEPAIVYVGWRPTAADAEGRITQARVWAPLCRKPDLGEGRLLPGLISAGKDRPCLATTEVALRGATRQSEAWAFGPEGLGLTARWVREEDRPSGIFSR